MIPKAYIDEAIEDMRYELYCKLRRGKRNDDEHYFRYAMDGILSHYVSRTGQEARGSISHIPNLREVECAFRERGHEVEWLHGKLLVTISDLTFSFEDHDDLYVRVYSKKQFITRAYYENPPVNMSSRSMLHLLEWFAKEAPSIREEVRPHIGHLCNLFRQGQIILPGITALIEDGMEDVRFRYGCMVEDSGMFLYLWIYEKDDSYPGTDTRLKVPYHALMDSPSYIKYVIRDIFHDKKNIEKYPQWNDSRSFDYKAYPWWSENRNAGVW